MMSINAGDNDLQCIIWLIQIRIWQIMPDIILTAVDNQLTMGQPTRPFQDNTAKIVSISPTSLFGFNLVLHLAMF